MWWAKLGLALMALGMMSTVPARVADEIGATARLITWCSQPDGTHGRGFCLAYIHAIAQRVEDVCLPNRPDQDRISVLMFLSFTDRHPEIAAQASKCLDQSGNRRGVSLSLMRRF